MFQPGENISVPYVLDNKGQDRVFDLWSRLNQDRIIFLGDRINDHVANIVVAQMLYLESQNHDAPIYLYINSPGGIVTSGYAILDAMNYITPEVHCTCVGQACSMGAVLLAAGSKRFALPNSTIMIHQPSGGFSGQSTDMQIHANYIQKMKETLTKIMAENTGQSYEKVYADMERDNFMSAEEAKEYGIVDEVVYKRPVID